jgi:hypothetical protein
MQAERAPVLGIALAVLVLVLECVGLIAYARRGDPSPPLGQRWPVVHHCTK